MSTKRVISSSHYVYELISYPEMEGRWWSYRWGATDCSLTSQHLEETTDILTRDHSVSTCVSLINSAIIFRIMPVEVDYESSLLWPIFMVLVRQRPPAAAVLQLQRRFVWNDSFTESYIDDLVYLLGHRLQNITSAVYPELAVSPRCCIDIRDATKKSNTVH